MKDTDHLSVTFAFTMATEQIPKGKEVAQDGMGRMDAEWHRVGRPQRKRFPETPDRRDISFYFESLDSPAVEQRTGELKRSIPGITERMLIRHLQELVRDGILRRDDKRTIPPCVYYSLSSYGRTLGPVVQMMCNWGRSHLKRLSAKQ
jgi:DNA-binding HxlR family transcriptional regulator